jgi:hypothetical protein
MSDGKQTEPVTLEEAQKLCEEMMQQNEEFRAQLDASMKKVLEDWDIIKFPKKYPKWNWNVPYEEVVVPVAYIGKKKYRSIEDPWEPSQI